MRVFVDTNILIDFVCNREGFVEQAKSLFALGYIGKLSLLTCALSYINAVYIGRKYNKASVVEKLSRLSAFVEVADLKGSVVVNSLKSDWTDYEDASQDGTAVIEQADCIVTRNKKDFAKSSLPVYTIEELFLILQF